jgi:hypothetical protein
MEVNSGQLRDVVGNEGASPSVVAVDRPRLSDLPSIVKDHLLWFESVNLDGDLLGVLTLGWRFEDALNDDEWSRRFSAFKFGDERSACAGRALLAHGLRSIRWGNAATPVGVVAALPSAAERLDPTERVASMAFHIARQLDFHWRGDILRKRATPAVKDLLSHTARREAIRGTYSCVESPHCGLIIVCDDFVTTGATMGEIARAIHARSPRTQVLGVALARNEHESTAGTRAGVVSNDHIPVSWADLWEKYARPRWFGRFRR